MFWVLASVGSGGAAARPEPDRTRRPLLATVYKIGFVGRGPCHDGALRLRRASACGAGAAGAAGTAGLRRKTLPANCLPRLQLLHPSAFRGSGCLWRAPSQLWCSRMGRGGGGRSAEVSSASPRTSASPRRLRAPALAAPPGLRPWAVWIPATLMRASRRPPPPRRVWGGRGQGLRVRAPLFRLVSCAPSGALPLLTPSRHCASFL